MERLAIVTGGGSGIGLATATAFVNAGIKTIIIGRTADKLDEAKATLGERCISKVFDLSKTEGMAQLIAEVVEEHGVPDILVNNAGINMKKALVEVTDEDFQSIIQTNLNAVFSISREVIKFMLQKQSGVVINISSMSSQYGIPYVIAYTATKSAIEGMTRAMATELSGNGIRVNCVAPGFIATAMSSKALSNDPQRMNKVLSRTPMGKLGEPADVAETILFLASEQAKYITGVVLPVDGGNSIGF